MPRKEQQRVPGVWEKVAGSGVWWIRFRVDGKLKREKVGRRGDAIALYQLRKSATRAGAKLPDNLRNTGVRFKELANAILVYSEAHHRDTRTINSRLSKLRADFDERKADTVKPQDIDAWLTANTKTPATSNRYRALFSLIYREGLRNGKVTSNPARLVRQRHENNGVIRWLKDEEEKRLRAVIAEHFPEHMPELVIALGMGMRLIEQFQLKWGSVDFKRKEVRLATTKNYSGRSIPMNSEVLRAFKRLQKDVGIKSDRVFPINNPRIWFATALRLAGITRFRWHDCRHTFCSRLAMRNQSLKVIQVLAGHKTIAITARSAHLDDVALRAVVDCLAKY